MPAATCIEYALLVRGLIRFVIWVALIVALIVGIARAVAIRWFRLPTDDPTLTTSLMPTLRAGDLVVAMRLTKPRLGDLVVCPEPGYPQRYVIGRIAAEPGDTITLTNGEPALNGESFKNERGCDPPVFSYVPPNGESEEIQQRCEWEVITNHLHTIGEIGHHKVPQVQTSVDVPPDTFFLLSDNRLFPYDSRDFGPVDSATCTETLVARLVSRAGWMDSENRLDYVQ